MAKIEGHVVKRGKRNSISRFFRARNDGEAIAAWRVDLKKILHVLNVRPFTSVRQLLTFSLQIEFPMATDVNTPRIRRETSSIHNAVLNLHLDVSNVGGPEVRGEAVNIRAADTDAHHDATSSRPVVSGVRYDPADDRTTTSKIHCNTSKTRGNPNQPVSSSCSLRISERLFITHHFPASCKVSDIDQ